MTPPISSILCLLLASRAGYAQRWFDQVNVTMCNWARFRANIIRDTIYLDGGSLWWKSGFSDGTYGIPHNNGNSQGRLFSYSLTSAFDVTATNLTSLFSRDLQPDDTATNFDDGTMFATYNEFLLFGGLTRPTDSAHVPGSRDLLGYVEHQWGPYRPSWEPNFIRPELPANMTRYITNGGDVSAPNENLGFYFGGLHAPNWGPIMAHDASANVSSRTLISVDLGQMGHEYWRNETLPRNIDTRADAEVVWLPVSSRGILAVIGGVVHPEVIYPGGLSDSQLKENNRTGPTYLKTIPIYDIASKKWYRQDTTGDVPPRGRAQFCAVAASASDGSSHNIYVYGGYDGFTAEQTPYDDVYILSLPSFTWFRAYAGTPQHGRQGHRCIKVFPDQMLVLGGRSRDPTICVEGGIIQDFNLNTLQFQDQYHPNRWSPYVVPQIVAEHIGGSGEGGANRTAPRGVSHNWTLASVFETPYTKSISTWFPYSTTSAIPSPSGGTDADKQTADSEWFIPIILAVTIPVCAAVCLVAIGYIWRTKLIHIVKCRGEQSYLKRLLCLLFSTNDSSPAEADSKQITERNNEHLPDVGSTLPAELPAEEHIGRGSPTNSSVCLTPIHFYPDTKSS